MYQSCIFVSHSSPACLTVNLLLHILESIPQTQTEAATSNGRAAMRSALIAEVIGTAILVQVGTAANCASLFLKNNAGMWEIAVVWILAATLAIYAAGSVSGGHLNPAVSFSFLIVRPEDCNFAKFIHYLVAQIVGAVLGSLVNMVIFCKAVGDFEASAGLSRGSAASIQSLSSFSDFYSLAGTDMLHAFILEAFGTAFLVFVVFAITNPRNNVPSSAVPVLVGAAIGAMVFTIGPFTKYVVTRSVYA